MVVAMLRTLQTCRLTRPARVRLSITKRCLTSNTKRKGVTPNGLMKTLEAEDSKVAAELEKEYLKQGIDVRVPKPSGRLPSLLNRASYKSSWRDVVQKKGESSSEVQAEPSRKGKEKAIEIKEAPAGPRRNPVGVQLLSPSLHSQLFPGTSLPKPPATLLDISKRHLNQNGLVPEGAAVLDELSFDMPPLRGSNMRDHFHALGQQTAEPYLSMAKEFAMAELPPKPTRWEMTRAGWTKYGSDGTMEPVDDLGEETLVSFDVETLYKLSSYPCMATAVTPNGWYSWLNPSIFEEPPTESPPAQMPWDTSIPSEYPHDLIPIFPPGSDIPRLVIGHNVGYDRARVLEEYDLKRTSTRWLDTLSFHVATRGITSVQRPNWMMYRKNKKEKLEREAEVIDYLRQEADADENLDLLEPLAESAAEIEAMHKSWQDVTAMNSLAEVASLHCGYPVDKSIRNRFGDESITHASQLRPELHDLLTYCGSDVKITHDVFAKVLPLYLDSCPHPASFAGILTMGSSFLPVNESWQEYLENAETKYREMNEGVKKALRVLAEKARKAGKQDDPWSQQLDWTEKTARWGEEYGPTQPEASTSSASTSNSSEAVETTTSQSTAVSTEGIPAWQSPLLKDPQEVMSNRSLRNLVPLLLRLTYKGHPVVYLSNHWWCFYVPQSQMSRYVDVHGAPVDLSSSPNDAKLERLLEEHAFFRIAGQDESRRSKLTGPGVRVLVRKGELQSDGYQDLLVGMTGTSSGHEEALAKCVEDMLKRGQDDHWGSQLDWTMTESIRRPPADTSAVTQTTKSKPRTKSPHGTWPKWYWDLTVPPTNDRVPFGELDLTTKKSVAPLLLRLQWQGYPLFHSREHKWVYRLPRPIYTAEKANNNDSRGQPVKFDSKKKGDEEMLKDTDHVYLRLPHKDGEGHNVGNPLSKSFVKPIESGELSSAAAEDGDEAAAKAAQEATNMNVLCSYWMSSRERIMDQMVVYKDGDRSKGMILPQVITMGTVTRRAVEATWLTASNAKKNRVGSELKAMVHAPPGYSIVGADVDSEELWIASIMGDSQFGLHGATAIGWMTLEGTKSAGTDLHSKTASILGISRDSAKVFNYSRIYGAGQKHAVQLLLQGDSTLTKKAAAERASKLYAATKGSRTFRPKVFRPAAIQSLWHGGSESYLFNTLEAIALSDRPTTPALGCGVTRALRKSYLENSSSYLPSRINWVVQSSGVDYLHLLIVSMEYLIKKYDIKARYLISVHDEVRYLAEESDRYRTALALQIANAWTRALFSLNLGIDDLPQGVAFFSAVDIDHVLRKEVFMTCETPSHPRPIPQGESFDIDQLLLKTDGGQLGPVVHPDDEEMVIDSYPNPPVALFTDITSSQHERFLKAQASTTSTPPKRWLEQQELLNTGTSWTPPPPSETKSKITRKRKTLKVNDIVADPGHDHEGDAAVAHTLSAADFEAAWEDHKKAATG